MEKYERDGEFMKVFISWSGHPSKEIAEVLAKYIPDVIQEAKPFYSDDIKIGEQWIKRLVNELDDTSFGILCMTQNNLRSTWLNYEAGVLAKPIGESKICPLLFDLQTSDITNSPLTIYQMTAINKDGMLKLFRSLNESCVNLIENDRLIRTFERVWIEIEKEINNIRENFKDKQGDIEPVASSEDMIRETLDIVRKLQLEKRFQFITKNGITYMINEAGTVIGHL